MFVFFTVLIWVGGSCVCDVVGVDVGVVVVVDRC